MYIYEYMSKLEQSRRYCCCAVAAKSVFRQKWMFSRCRTANTALITSIKRAIDRTNIDAQSKSKSSWIEWKLVENDRVKIWSSRPEQRLLGKVCRHVSPRVLACFEWFLEKIEAIIWDNTTRLCPDHLSQYSQSDWWNSAIVHFFRRWSCSRHTFV